MNIHKSCRFSVPLTLLMIFLTIIGLSSCTRFGEGSIKLPANPILSRGIGWAVVKDAYVRLKEGPSDSTRDIDHLRRGSVYRLDARVFGSHEPGSTDTPLKPGERGFWYGIESGIGKGWVRETELDIYSTQPQAERAATAYR
jgi:hypothetical protein